MADDKKQPIVIKKVVKGGGRAHHGGTWKVAYADFVTAMMAFFLLLWLLGITDDQQREGVSDWFKNPAGVKGPGGASTSVIKLGGALDRAKTVDKIMPKRLQKTHDEPKKDKAEDKDRQKDKEKDTREGKQVEVIKLVESKKQLVEEKKRLDDLLVKLRKAIDKSQTLRPFKDQLLLDISPDGLRIQIVDKKNRPMFALGSAELKPYTRVILNEIGRSIAAAPNGISISGHTDARPFYGADRKDYSNWELSSDRANAARRALVGAGMKESKIGRVVGLSSSVLFDKKDPLNPSNRRISIVILNKAAAEGIARSEGTTEPPTDKSKEKTPDAAPENTKEGVKDQSKDKKELPVKAVKDKVPADVLVKAKTESAKVAKEKTLNTAPVKTKTAKSKDKKESPVKAAKEMSAKTVKDKVLADVPVKAKTGSAKVAKEKTLNTAPVKTKAAKEKTAKEKTPNKVKTPMRIKLPSIPQIKMKLPKP